MRKDFTITYNLNGVKQHTDARTITAEEVINLAITQDIVPSITHTESSWLIASQGLSLRYGNFTNFQNGDVIDLDKHRELIMMPTGPSTTC